MKSSLFHLDFVSAQFFSASHSFPSSFRTHVELWVEKLRRGCSFACLGWLFSVRVLDIRKSSSLSLGLFVTVIIVTVIIKNGLRSLVWVASRERTDLKISRSSMFHSLMVSSTMLFELRTLLISFFWPQCPSELHIWGAKSWGGSDNLVNHGELPIWKGNERDKMANQMEWILGVPDFFGLLPTCTEIGAAVISACILELLLSILARLYIYQPTWSTLLATLIHWFLAPESQEHE